MVEKKTRSRLDHVAQAEHRRRIGYVLEHLKGR